METIYFVIMGVMLLLAVSDLVFGVANDAVNFMNSAVGARAAPRKVILIVAGVGIVAGTLFSGGMMEVARKGIFNPEMFVFSDVIVIFTAVMISDIIILDLFNTFGLPTSTTVSLVFELLGAAVMVSAWKLVQMGMPLTEVEQYINSSQALTIIIGILLSLVFAFIAGTVLQWISRLLFSFRHTKSFKRYGALWAAVVLSAITWLLSLKGLKYSALWDYPQMSFLSDNTYLLFLCGIPFWFIILAFMQLVLKIRILKYVVLAGTFTLALSFAANDLVNFIGVPLAALNAFTAAYEAGNDQLLMTVLRGKSEANVLILLASGGIMMLTLYFSQKARTVTRTEVGLGSHAVVTEKFRPSIVARGIVNIANFIGGLLLLLVPRQVKNMVSKRFEYHPPVNDGAAFDLIRASVNLMAASLLISGGTLLKLPLSTTYVTFIVAMGASFADGAWNKDNSVQRVNGVITVISGWFVTAIAGFTIAGLLAFLLHNALTAGTIIMALLVPYLIWKSNHTHRKRENENVLQDYF